ncbi:hypothetical protein [Capnocytophaga sputigena]|uniref:Lipoprotein n=1 Tax=Capnocytophaga sputigena TaxID=1019 RepID=A0AAX2IDH6_CAPSP|nr:hypothetical protein [Capnocytophaga sputigena]ATA84988.1 hypothetical protein CGC55_10990 [Capnocytophaga sputigena]EEB66340.1 hypothetical protein CAPSP0001_0041 [Capnocytophaga sputigena ATCC 33612]SQA76293.1 Uncharacterised protein [Capnocytophaga sputigena]
MKKILVILAFIGLSSCQEQRTSQKSVEEQTEPSEVTQVENPEEARLKRYLTFKSYFKKEIKLPADFTKEFYGSREDTLPKTLYNQIIFSDQERNKIQEYAKFYTLDGELIDRVNTYGILDTTPSNAGSYRHKENFETKVYPLGYIKLSEEYDTFVTKVCQIDVIYIDVFVFSKEGNIKSFVSVFEIDPLRDCEKTWEDFVYNYKVDTYFIQSRIQKNHIIKWTEKRFGMTIKTEWQLQKDGYFKVIKLKKEGKNEWLED